MHVQEFIEENFDYQNLLLQGYDTLNSVNLPTKLYKFPYNILRLDVTPTYKTIHLNYIEGKSLQKKDGGSLDVFVFLF